MMEHTAPVPSPTLPELSEIGAENNPNRVAFGDGRSGDTITWEAFDARSNRAAHGMERYASQGDRIVFLCDSGVDHVTLWNGALKAGCVVSNLHIRQSPTTTQSCIDSLRPRVLVVDEATSALFEDEIRGRLSTDLNAVVTTGEPQTEYEQSLSSFVEGEPDTAPDVRVQEDDIAAVLWTSGTTGKPKGWCHSHRALFMRGTKLAHKKAMSRRTRVLNVFTPSFAAWSSTVLPAMVSNAGTYFLNEWDPGTYLQTIQDRSITQCNLVPTMWREILRLDERESYDLSSLRKIESAGETLNTTTLKRLREHICDSVSQSYASTEVSGTSITDSEMRGERIDSIGKPIVGSRIRIVENGGSPDDTLPPGEVGEIVVKSSDAPSWAWKNSAKTDATFENGWWHSGDLGYKDEDGYIFLEGRDDDMILSKGIKVYPAPVEERLNEHPDVKESAVVGIEDEEYGERVVAEIHTDNPELSAEELDEWCLESDDLARMERPRTYYFTDETLPRTASDKLDRHAVKEARE